MEILFAVFLRIKKKLANLFMPYYCVLFIVVTIQLLVRLYYITFQTRVTSSQLKTSKVRKRKMKKNVQLRKKNIEGER